MRRVLFLCSHNAARSQMAEGFLRAYGGDRFAVQSAGTVATAVHPLAVRAMHEVGIDIGSQRSKSVDDVGEGWDVVVTVCDANCPIPPRSGLRLRWHLPDPALAGGSEDERLQAFRGVRDAIQKRVRSLVRAPGMRGRSSDKEGSAQMQDKHEHPDQGDVDVKKWPESETGRQSGEGQVDVGKKGGSGNVGRPGDKTGKESR
jgi:arsenate reductase (thioredoxin)